MSFGGSVPSNLRTSAWADTRAAIADSPFVKLPPPATGPIQAPAPLPPIEPAIIVHPPTAAGAAVPASPAAAAPATPSSSKKEKYEKAKVRRESSAARNRTTPHRGSSASFAAPTASSNARLSIAPAPALANPNAPASAAGLLSPAHAMAATQSSRYRSSRTPSPVQHRNSLLPNAANGSVPAVAINNLVGTGGAASSAAAQTAMKAAASLLSNSKARQSVLPAAAGLVAGGSLAALARPKTAVPTVTVSAPTTPQKTPRKKLEYDAATGTSTLVTAQAFSFQSTTGSGSGSGEFAVPLARTASSASMSRPQTASVAAPPAATDSTSSYVLPTGESTSAIANSSSNAIKVLLRVRPFNSDEKADRSSDETEAGNNAADEKTAASGTNSSGPASAVEVISNRTVSLGSGDATGRGRYNTQQQYSYDSVLGPDSTQMDVFEAAGRPIADNCVAGYNATIFAYGQTGAGKTHTMTGSEDAEGRGLIPRLLEYLFAVTRRASTENPNKSFRYTCSFLEIYNEEPRDLLAGVDGAPITNRGIVFNTVEGNVIAIGLTRVEVKTVDQLMPLLKTGSARRATAATKMNDRSSRGHSVFTLELETMTRPATSPTAAAGTESKDGAAPQSGLIEKVVSCLHLVDLAGSESAKNSGATGKAAGEGSNINKSLSTLSRVIKILAERDSSQFVPYRDSKLTHFLTNALGGNSKTCLIANVSPAIRNRGQTKSTLQFASQCKTIVTEPAIQKQMVQYVAPAIVAAAEADKKRLAEVTIENQKLKEMVRSQIERDHVSQTKSWEAITREQKLIADTKALKEKVIKFHELCQSQNNSLTERETAKASRDKQLRECGLLNPYDDSAINGDAQVWAAIAKLVSGGSAAAASAGVSASAPAAGSTSTEVEHLHRQIESLTHQLATERAKSQLYAQDLEMEQWKFAHSNKSAASSAASTPTSAAAAAAAAAVAGSISLASSAASSISVQPNSESKLSVAGSVGSIVPKDIASCTRAELEVMLEATQRDNKRRQYQLQRLVHTVRNKEWEFTHVRRAISRWQRIKSRNAAPAGSISSAPTASNTLAVANASSVRKSGAGVGLWTAFDARLVKRIEKISATAEAERKQRRDSTSLAGAMSRMSMSESGAATPGIDESGSTTISGAVSAELASAFEHNRLHAGKPTLIVPAGSGSTIAGVVPAGATGAGDSDDEDPEESDITAPARLSVHAVLESVDSELRDRALYNQLSPTKLVTTSAAAAPVAPAATTAVDANDENKATAAAAATVHPNISSPPARAATEFGVVIAKSYPLSPLPPPSMPKELSGAIGAVQTPVSTKSAVAMLALPRLTTVTTIASAVAVAPTPTAAAAPSAAAIAAANAGSFR